MSSRLNKDEKLKVIEHFLLSTPPGEFEDVLKDVQELVQDNRLINEQALNTFRRYNLEQLIPVEVSKPSPHKVILSKYGHVDGDRFIDPVGGNIITVDHALGSVVNVKSAPSEGGTVKKRREILQKACDSYVKNRYLDGISTVFPSKGNSNEFYICISSSKFNEKNFWSGRWRSVYQVTFEGDTKVKVSGSMKVNVHYYENGNIQLNTSRQYQETITGDFGKTIEKALEKSEGNFQDQVDTTCQNLTNIFKLLRRRLPITKTKFNFGSMQHDLVKQYAKK